MPPATLKVLQRVARGDEGQALIEYGMLGALIAAVAAGAVAVFGGDVKALWDTIAAAI